MADQNTEADRPTIGSSVRIMADEYPHLVGTTGTVTQLSSDGTTAWVESEPPHGVWCSISNLSVIPATKSDRR